MLQVKPTQKMADFSNIFTLCTRQLICAITYRKFQGEGMVSYPSLVDFDDVRGPLGCIEVD